MPTEHWLTNRQKFKLTHHRVVKIFDNALLIAYGDSWQQLVLDLVIGISLSSPGSATRPPTDFFPPRAGNSRAVR
jgi:hypothetical protein